MGKAPPPRIEELDMRAPAARHYAELLGYSLTTMLSYDFAMPNGERRAGMREALADAQLPPEQINTSTRTPARLSQRPARNGIVSKRFWRPCAANPG